VFHRRHAINSSANNTERCDIDTVSALSAAIYSCCTQCAAVCNTSNLHSMQTDAADWKGNDAVAAATADRLSVLAQSTGFSLACSAKAPSSFLVHIRQVVFSNPRPNAPIETSAVFLRPQTVGQHLTKGDQNFLPRHNYCSKTAEWPFHIIRKKWPFINNTTTPLNNNITILNNNTTPHHSITTPHHNIQ